MVEAEFKSGVTADNNGIVHGVVDLASEKFLTVGADGFKLSGVQDAINSAINGLDSSTGTTSEFHAITSITITDGKITEVGQTDKINSAITSVSAETVDLSGVKNADDLKAIEALTATSGILRKTGENAWDLANVVTSLDGVASNGSLVDALTVKNAISGVDTKLQELSGSVQTLSSTTESFSAATVAGIAGLDTKISDETTRATAAEDSISANVTTLSSATETFSAATVAEIARVDGRIDSTDTSLSELSASTKAFSSATVAEIARLDSDIDNETARATAAEDSISANVATLSSTTEAFSAGTVAKFELMESGWNVPGSIKHTIEDAFIKSVAVGSSEDSNKTLMRYYNDGDEHKYYVSSSANDMYYNGLPLSTVIKNIEDEIAQSSSDTDELSAATINEVARLDGRIDNEIARATAAENSISGTVNTLSAATESEIERIEDKLSDNERVTSEAINQIKDEIDKTQEGAGLNEDGSYHKHNTADDMGNYITNATSLDDADMMLDSALKAESDRAIAAEESISGIVNTFSAATESTIRDLQEQLTEANSIIETLKTEIQTLSGVVETIESQMAENIYSTVKTMLQGASRQIKVTPDDANKQLTIGFSDDAIFGQ